MLDELEHFLFQSFILAIRLTLQIIWIIVRPLLPIILGWTFRLLLQPLSWPFITIVALWLHSDHGILASVLAVVAAAISMFVLVTVRSGVR